MSKDEDIFDFPKFSEWNFVGVPDEEIIACCLWEYARESPSLGLAAEEHQIRMRRLFKKMGPPPEVEKATRERDQNIRGHAESSGFDYNKFLGAFWDSDLGYIEFYDFLRQNVMNEAPPWQDLLDAMRPHLVGSLSQSFLWQPLCPANVGELEGLWKANNAGLMEVRSRKRDPNDDQEDGALHDPTQFSTTIPEKPSDSEREVIAAFKVDFSRFTDTEIEAEFRSWLKLNRPKRWRKPESVFPDAKRRGQKKNEYRVALERLGMMRLLHWHTPEKIRTMMPEAWKLYGRKQSVFRREIRAAARFFREHFPFLPRDERPHSYERYTTWMRPIQRHLDRLGL
jgi:hypothetical protein